MRTIVSTKRFNGSGFPYTEEHMKIQEDAYNTWAALGYRVVYINHSGKIFCRELATECANYPSAILVNADIMLKSAIDTVVNKLEVIGAPAWATSYQMTVLREEFEGEPGTRLIDEGLPIFIGNRAFWTAWANECPPTLCFQGPLSDNVLCSWANKRFPKTGYDFTALACVYHPMHEGREETRNEFNKDIKFDLSTCHLPMQKITGWNT